MIDYRVFALFLLLLASGAAQSATIILKDGRQLVGRVVDIAGVADDPNDPRPMAGEVKVTPILLVDDGLRRTYVGKIDIRQILEQDEGKQVKIRLWQNVANRGGGVGRVGRKIQISPFDSFGRRIYEMQSTEGPLAIVQGITEITPTYVRIQGLMGVRRPIVWDMRMATSSIPSARLSAILHQVVPSDDYEARLQIVQLYLQAERYPEARKELEGVLADFPERKELENNIRQLRQLGAKSILKEIELRRKAGQHQLVEQLLRRFPAEEVAGETLQQVREILFDYEKRAARKTKFLDRLAVQTEKIKDPIHQQMAKEFLAEVTEDLSYSTLARAASFLQLEDDDSLSAEQKVALAMSGWLLGSTEAIDRFAIAVSLMEVRDNVVAYLREPQAAKRAALVAEIRDLEGGTPERVAQILKLIKPPEKIDQPSHRGHGFFEMGVELPAPGGLVRYLVQLPPDYDPLRTYPTLVTLNGQGYSPELQLDYWAGGPREGAGRRGQAMRQGYITIAVDWQIPHQINYAYTLREHQAVLGSVRDALRRFSIDTDRLFLTGHDIGGDAAWDIGLAHPDLWAGVIPFMARADRYCSRYRDNAKYVDWYFVAGELNGGKIEHNSHELDLYLRPGIPATLVEYLGRGQEPYHDEIQRLFDWMNRRSRRAPPKEFECKSMRPWDSFFWWLELEGLPEKSMVPPNAWPPKRGTRPAQLRGRLYQNNKIGVFCQAEKTTVWLAPDFVDFDQPLTIELNNRKIGSRDRFIRPDISVILEDARTRGERQRPYWAKVSS